MKDVVICSYARTPIGKFGGSLKDFSAPELGSIAIKGALAKINLNPADVDEVIMGHVLQAGVGQNPARQAALKAGCPGTVSAFTVNKVCGSGLKAVMLAAQSIRCGDNDIIVAGGMEAMSSAPYLLKHARDGQRLGHDQLIDAMINDGLWCPFEDWHMGSAAEHIANSHDISREEQDRFSAQSQQRAAQAQSAGHFKAEIVPVEVPQRKADPILFDSDEGVRSDASAEGLGKLRPVFDRKQGSVTAGNASTINDGGAVLILTTRTIAEERNWPIKAVIREQAVGGVEPKEIFWAPVIAVKNLLNKASLDLADVDLIEANEAFAAQVLANGKGLGLDESKVNVWGGAIALGHPIGCSGARVLITLINSMEQLDKKEGIATLCLGGGNAVALRVTR